MDQEQEKSKKSDKRWSHVLASFMGGVLGGLLVALGSQYLLLDQELMTTATVSIDTTQFRAGSGSVEENFNLQPARTFKFASGDETVGGFVHLQVSPDPSGTIHGMDWRRYSSVKFFAMASTQGFVVTEVNLFVGPDYVQYTFHGKGSLVLGTRWQEFTIPLSGFALAPWEPRTGKNSSIDLGNVTAFGLDEKTSSTPLVGYIWLDDVRLVDHDGKQTLLSNCSQFTFQFQGHEVRWVASGRRYS